MSIDRIYKGNAIASGVPWIPGSRAEVQSPWRTFEEVTGRSFNALLLIVDDRVVYTLYGGQPNVNEQEVSRQPLGPAQDFGESLPLGSLLR